jgi:hypothetical protein
MLRRWAESGAGPLAPAPMAKACFHDLLSPSQPLPPVLTRIFRQLGSSSHTAISPCVDVLPCVRMKFRQVAKANPPHAATPGPRNDTCLLYEGPGASLSREQDAGGGPGVGQVVLSAVDVTYALPRPPRPPQSARTAARLRKSYKDSYIRSGWRGVRLHGTPCMQQGAGSTAQDARTRLANWIVYLILQDKTYEALGWLGAHPPAAQRQLSVAVPKMHDTHGALGSMQLLL